MSERPFSEIVKSSDDGGVEVDIDFPAGKLKWALSHNRVHELISALWLANGQDPVYDVKDSYIVAAWLRALDGYPHTTSDPFANMDRGQLWDACHALAQELLSRRRLAAVRVADIVQDTEALAELVTAIASCPTAVATLRRALGITEESSDE